MFRVRKRELDELKQRALDSALVTSKDKNRLHAAMTDNILTARWSDNQKDWKVVSKLKASE
jgi:hypothetical protein